MYEYQQQHQQQQNSRHVDSQPVSSTRHVKPSLTIDVVSDVSFHDDPSIDMMSSLATNDTNSLTDYWRGSNQRSSPTLEEYGALKEVEEEDDIDSKEQLLDPHPSHCDPPGTFADDLDNSPFKVREGGRSMNRQLHGRDPSVGGDSTRYSQPSVVRRNDQQICHPSAGSSPYRNSALRSFPSKSASHYSSNAPSFRNDSSQGWHQPQPQPPRQQQLDDDAWDIEFVSSPDNGQFGECEASSLGNLTGDYEEPPLASAQGGNNENDDDTATNTMDTVDLVAEVKRVWRHVQKYEKKKQKKRDIMSQYTNNQGDGLAEQSMESMMMGHFQSEEVDNRNEHNMDDTRISELSGFSQINRNGAAAMRSDTGANAAQTNNYERRSPLEQHIQQSSNHGQRSSSAERSSYTNASRGSTEKDVAFVNDGVDLFFGQSQTRSNNANKMVHPRPIHSSSQNKSQPKNTHANKKSTNSHLAQPYEMTKTRSTGTALTQKTSNKAGAPIHNYSISKSESTHTSSSSHTSSKARVDLARKYMKQHGGARFPRSRSPLVNNSSTSAATASADNNMNMSSQNQSSSGVVNGNARITVQHGNNRGGNTPFRVT